MKEKQSKLDIPSTLDSYIQKTRIYTITDSNVEKVVENLISRSNVGLIKYGVTTERSDLGAIEWLQHLQEELMDACIYIQTLKGKLNELRSLSETDPSNSNLS